MIIEIDTDVLVDAILGIVSDHAFLVSSAVICVLLGIIFLKVSKSILSYICIMIAGANLVIQGINLLGAI